VPGCSGRNIRSAYVTRDRMNRPEIGFQFDDEGKKAFADLTATNIGRQLAILVDGEVYSAPVIRSEIRNGSGVIAGNFTDKDAFELAVLLQNPLEVPIKLIEEKSF
jgi:SecD/SecF fusion protein